MALMALALCFLASEPVGATEVLTSVPIFAQDTNELDCKSWETLRSHRTPETTVVEAWAFGYATAYVGFHATPPGLTFTKEQLLPLIDVACGPEQNNNYVWAATAAVLDTVLTQATK